MLHASPPLFLGTGCFSMVKSTSWFDTCRSEETIRKGAFLKSMGSKTHVYPCWWRVVPPDGQHTARWTNLSRVFSQVAILVYYKMAIGCFSKSPTAIIITIIPNIISVSNTKLKVFWVQTNEISDTMKRMTFDYNTYFQFLAALFYIDHICTSLELALTNFPL